CAGWRNQHANDAPLDHSIEVSCPRREGWSLYQLLFRLRVLILREGRQGQRGRDAQDAQKNMLHEISEVVLVCLVSPVHLVGLVQPNKPDKRDKPDEPAGPQMEAMLAFTGLRGQEREGGVGKELRDFATNRHEYGGMRLRQTT